VMTSLDCITWTSRTSAADNQWRSVTYSNGIFCCGCCFQDWKSRYDLFGEHNPLGCLSMRVQEILQFQQHQV
jgi:hypothetical protein